MQTWAKQRHLAHYHGQKTFEVSKTRIKEGLLFWRLNLTVVKQANTFIFHQPLNLLYLRGYKDSKF